MYDESKTTDTLSNNIAGLIGGTANLANPQVTPLQGTLSTHGEQIGKLGELIGQLADRLMPLRNMQPQAEPSVGQNMVNSSQIVELILHKTEEVKYLQSRVAELLQDLEI